MPVLTCFGVGGSAPRVYYTAAKGDHVIELAWVGNWIFNDLTAITRGETPSQSPSTVTCFGVNGNDPRVYFPATSGNHIQELAWVGHWVQSDITVRAGAPLASSIALTCFGVDGSDPRVYCTTPVNNPPAPPDGHVVELALVGGWTHKDVTAITGAPAIANNSDLTCFGFDVSAFGAGGPASRVYYVSQNGHVNELAWNVESFQDPEGKWVHNDVTVLAGAPMADPFHLTCVGVGGVQGLIAPSAHIYYLDRNQHVNELGWVGRWVATDLTAITGASPAQQGSPLTCFAVGGSAPRVYYLDGHVNELAWDGTRWIHTDVTALAGGPSPVGFADLACFGVDGSAARIYYYTPSNGHVNELGWIGRWVATDLTAITGAPPLPSLS